MLAWLEHSTLGQLMRDSSLWTYPIVNLAHILGIASLFGATLVLDLRLLGVWRRVPLAPLVEVTVPVAKAGFLLAVVTGAGLLATKATEYAGNPYLPMKFTAIGLGLVNVAVLSRWHAWPPRDDCALSDRENRRLMIAGGISLVCWLSAITAGRLIAYW